jgi:ankyrin repeat protein
VKDVEYTLKSLPLGLKDLYQRIVDELGTQNAGNTTTARQMLRWASFAERPLTVGEFQDAMAVSKAEFLISKEYLATHRHQPLELMPNWIATRCGNLLEIRKRDISRSAKSSDIVQLLHQTVREFLIQSDKPGPLNISELQNDTGITTACIHYVMLSLSNEVIPDNIRSRKDVRYWTPEDYWLFVSHLLDRPLLSYALTFLPQYLNDCNTEKNNTGEALKLYLRHIHDEPLAPSWSFLASWAERLPKGFSIEIHSNSSHAIHFRIATLVTAARYGYIEVVKSLVAVRTSINAFDHKNNAFALEAAARSGHDEIVIYLAELGASSTGALQGAVSIGNERIVKLLLDRGVDAGAQYQDGETVLHRAVVNGYAEVVILLLKKGADREARDSNGWTALHLAAANAYDIVVQLLLNGGADVEAADKDGWTALHLGAVKSHLTVVKTLLKGGANIEARDKWGCTPLQQAVLRGHIEIVQVLLENGAKAGAEGEPPVDPLVESLFESPVGPPVDPPIEPPFPLCSDCWESCRDVHEWMRARPM